MEDESARPVRLMNFVSEEQLEESKKSRGERVEDGTAQRDRPLYEILKENKDKRDAEFNERFKHRPPKALDEDETEFLDKLEMSTREYERQMADEEAQQLRSFQLISPPRDLLNFLLAAVAAQSNVVHELKEPPTLPVEDKTVGRKNPPARPLGVLIKVKPPAKKAKIDPQGSEEYSDTRKTSGDNGGKTSDLVKTSGSDGTNETHDLPISCLVSYSDESEEETD
ncbi:PSME3-interacting protein isoform X1 [Rhodamnia argentea]|uniref:PSME3-interacting protein isoform X1 n=1 Tax=Rhodamnia argentea TaxID=178133 RepID=A0ABM3HZE4_9MYRT|nr:PSME3-interacting protein isoform X1 [Rhodamnia argentea]